MLPFKVLLGLLNIDKENPQGEYNAKLQEIRNGVSKIRKKLC